MKKVIPFSKVGSKFIRYDRLEIDKWFEQHKIVGVEA
jgi:predicted DNA-binding transcriptional regulator AlpA